MGEDCKDIAPRVHIHFIRTVDEKLVRQACALYASEFKGPNGIPLSLVRSHIESGKYQLHVGLLDSRFVAMALIWTDTHNVFTHVDYLAVKRAFRRKGIGSNLLAHIIEHAPTDLQTVEVVPEDVPFYARYGFVPAPFTYLFPASKKQVLFTLMMRNGSGAPLSATNIEYVVKALYCDLHNKKRTNARLQSCLASIRKMS